MIKNSRPFSPSRCMNIAIKAARLEKEAGEMFMTMPNLRVMALKYCRYISPYVPSGNHSLIELALGDAIRAYIKTHRRNERAILRYFLGALVDRIDALCEVRISVQNRSGCWLIWDYEQPLYELMVTHKRKTVQIKVRETAVEQGPVLVKMLANVCTTRDLNEAGVDLHALWRGQN